MMRISGSGTAFGSGAGFGACCAIAAPGTITIAISAAPHGPRSVADALTQPLFTVRHMGDPPNQDTKKFCHDPGTRSWIIFGPFGRDAGFDAPFRLRYCIAA